MKHPTDAEWMEVLYGEVTAEVAEAREIHRRACPECQARVAAWRLAMDGLSSDAFVTGARIPAGIESGIGVLVEGGAANHRAAGGEAAGRESHEVGFPWLRWMAMAAAWAVLIAGGYVMGGRGRVAARDVEEQVNGAVARAVGAAEKRWRDEQSGRVAEAVRGELARVEAAQEARLLEVVEQMEQARLADYREWLAVSLEAEERHAKEIFQLRAGLSALAQQAGVGLQKAASQIHMLASYLPAPETGDSARENPAGEVPSGTEPKD